MNESGSLHYEQVRRKPPIDRPRPAVNRQRDAMPWDVVHFMSDQTAAVCRQRGAGRRLKTKIKENVTCKQCQAWLKEHQ